MADQAPLKIVFLDRGTLGVPLREPSFPHSYTEYDATSPEQIVERLADADIAIINKVQVRTASLEKLPKLKMIAVAATGTDCVDKAYCKAHNIPVINIRNYAVNTVPEHTLALIFALRRSLIPYTLDVRKGKWQTIDQFCYFDHPIRDISGSTLGLIGYGALGKSVATRAEALGMKVIATDVYDFPGKVDLDTILKESDIVSLHCPLTDGTRNIIGAAELKKMKKDAILINTARGGLVDEAALVDALKTGEIGGAGFDVLTVEPPKNGNVLLDQGADLPNLIITPHVAWASHEAMTGLANQLVENIELWVAGTPRNLVTE
ncbi:D-2-hydroxyacid dehydrogenase [Methyloferula stellata]|uniref:D-2-hydroxyacid dehydrogenase n=1 Tax=Methyloferula stellata TaxID=876270 RepID=UPI00037E3C0B|nr:D-2-hydroxyacid dehydrogenase [Methyloferula stellata]